MTEKRQARSYDASGRRARAAEGRRRVVVAAHDLFVGRGFAATTIADIAAAAGVSPPTVYAAFGTKATLLKTCIDVAIAGDDTDVAVVDRPLSQWVYDTDDAREVLARYAVMMGELAARAGPIYDVLVRAADSEPALAALLADLERQRLRAATIVAEAVAARGGLPAGPHASRRRATRCGSATRPSSTSRLTRKRRWSTKRYVAWSRNTLLRLVADPPIPGDVPRGASGLQPGPAAGQVGAGDEAGELGDAVLLGRERALAVAA